jgi:hypothetical protein
MVVGQVLLKAERPLEDVGRRRHGFKGAAQVCLELAVVPSRACRVELLQFTDRAKKEAARQVS